MTLDELKVILYLMKNMCLHNVVILEKFKKNWAFNQKIIAEKDDFEILR